MSSNLEDLIVRGTRAAQPAAGIPGRLYYVTDESVTERDNGSAWQDVSDAGAGTPGGSTTQFQYNNAGVFAGTAGLVFVTGELRANVGTWFFRDGTDPTKQLQFNLGNLSASTVAALLIPDVASPVAVAPDAGAANNFLTGITTLGAITKAQPSFANLSGTLDLGGAQASGTLAAGRFPALTGDVTTVAGALATTIAANAVTTAKILNANVTLAKLADMATASLIYRKTAGSGAPEVNSLATLKTDLGLAGSNTGDQTITLTGDVTGTGAGSFAATIAADAVTFAKIQNASVASVLVGRRSGSAGDFEEITLGTNLSMSGTTLNATGGGGSGDVVGPGAATDNALARFDTATGKLIQNSAVTVSDTTPTFSTSATEMVFEQTGDSLGTSRFRLQNRGGSGGGLFENVGLDLAEFGFKPNTGPQANLRLEHRGASQFDSTANPHGEIHFVENTLGGASVVFSHVLGQAKSFLGGEIFLGTPTSSAILAPADTSFLRQAAGVTRFKNSLDVVTGYQVGGAALNFSHLAGAATTAQITDDAVTYAKIQNVSATSRFLGRITAGAGDTEELTAANAKTILALTSSDVGLGNVTNDAQTKAAIVPNIAPSSGQILVGNAGGTAYANVNMSADATITNLGALTIATKAVSLAKMADMATASLIYRKTAGSGVPEVNTLATLKTDLAYNFTDLAGDFALTQTPSMTLSRLIGRGASGGSGDWQEIILGTGLVMTGTTLSVDPAPSNAGNVMTSNGSAWIAKGTASAVVTANVDQTATAEQIHVTRTIAANEAQVGSVYHIHAAGVCTNGTTAITFTPKIKWGGIAGSEISGGGTPFTSTTTARSNQPWTLDAYVTVRAIGASGALLADVIYFENTTSATGVTTVHPNNPLNPTTLATNASKDLVLTWTLSATTGTPHLITVVGFIELIAG